MAVSSRYTKGIEIEIGGNATKLKTALDSANRAIRTTQSELDTLRNSLKLEWDPSKFQRAQELARRALEETERKAEVLRKGLAAMGDPGSFSETQRAQYEALRRELSYVEVAAQRAREQLKEVSRASEQSKIDLLTGELEDVSAGLETTGAKLDRVRAKLERKWNAKQFDEAQELAQRAISQTEQKAELLRQKLAALDEAGTDKTSAEYQRLEKELTEAEEAAEEARQALQRINQIRLDQINQGLSSAAGNLKAMGSTMTRYVTLPLAAAGAAGITFASDMAESINKVDVAFGDASESVKRWSDTTLSSIGLAKGTALDMAALYGDMATSMGLSQKEASALSMTLVNLAGDLSSFKNENIEQVNTALKGIFTGETESLKELGVVMTQTQLEAYALAAGYQTAYTEMDQAQQVMLRYQYVMDATKNAQGDFARTSDGTSNQLRILKESLKEAGAAAGEELLPIITPLIQQLAELIQNFGDLDEGTRRAVVQTGLFLATLGPAQSVMGGLTGAISKGVEVYGALRTAQAAAAAGQTALNVAMSANAIGAAITVAGTLASVLASLAVTYGLTADAGNALAESVEKNRKSREEEREELQAEQDDLLSMVTALETLSEAEDKSATQKATMLELVEQLNEAVPSLSLAYDAQADSLNMTTEAIRALVEAQAEQALAEQAVKDMVEIQKDQLSLEEELTEAKRELVEAQTKFDAALEETTSRMGDYEGISISTSTALQKARKRVEELTEQYEANEAEMDRLEGIYGKYNATAEETVSTMDGAGSVAEQAAAKLKELSGVLSETQGAYDLLAQAQKEQSETGYLELNTVAELLEKYPQLYPYLIETADGYQLADGALEQYLATQRTEYEVALNEARRASIELINQSGEETAAIHETTAALKLKLQALIAVARGQINALAGQAPSNGSMYSQAAWVERQEGYQAAKVSLDSYVLALRELEKAEADLASYDRTAASLQRESSSQGKKTSSSKSSTGRKEKTPAEQDLEAYQAAVKELDHLRAMDLLSEEEYYQRKAELGARYLGANQDERWKLEEELHTWQAGAYERDLQALQEALDAEEITWQEYLQGMQQARMDHLTKGSEEWIAAVQAEQEKARELKEESYEDQLADLQYFLDLDLIREEDYYRTMGELRDYYLEENSDAWRKATVALYEWQKEQREKQLEALEDQFNERLDAAKESYDAETEAIQRELEEQKDLLKEHYEEAKEAAKEAYEAEKDALKSAYEEKTALIEAELEAEKERLNAVLEGIDAELQARRELREDEKQDDAIAKAKKRLEAAQAQLAYARDEEERLEWEKEVARLQKELDKAIQDKEDTLFEREKEQEKEEIRDQIEAAEEAADAAKEAAKADYEAALAKLEADYDAKVEQMEAAYQASLERLEAEYERRLADAREEYERRVAELQAQYEASKSQTEPGGRSTARTGGAASSGGLDLDGLGGILGAVTSGIAAIQKVMTTNHINNSRTATLTYNVAGGMTEGQVARTVRKTLDELGR